MKKKISWDGGDVFKTKYKPLQKSKKKIKKKKQRLNKNEQKKYILRNLNIDISDLNLRVGCIKAGWDWDVESGYLVNKALCAAARLNPDGPMLIVEKKTGVSRSWETNEPLKGINVVLKNHKLKKLWFLIHLFLAILEVTIVCFYRGIYLFRYHLPPFSIKICFFTHF